MPHDSPVDAIRTLSSGPVLPTRASNGILHAPGSADSCLTDHGAAGVALRPRSEERKARSETDLGTMAVAGEGAVAQLAVSDVLMRVQYYDALRRDSPETQAIKRLMFAVLAGAVRCFQTYADAQSCAGRRMFGEAEWWISDRNSEGPFTFQAICETLGIESDRLRDGLHQWRVQQSGGMNSRRLARRAQVRSVGPISSPQRPQPRASDTPDAARR